MGRNGYGSFPALVLAIGLFGFVEVGRAESPEFDIVGLRLGMSVEEIKAALQDYDPEITLGEERQRYIYSDGINHNFETPDFVAYVHGSRKVVSDNIWGDEGFVIYFTPMPDGQRATFIKRSQTNTPNPPTGRQYNEALINKYGQPAAVNSSGLRWEFPAGRVDCTVGAGTYDPSRGNFLRYVFEGGAPGRFHKRGVHDLSECASFLDYQTGAPDGPAANVTGVMVDVKATAQGELDANAWVAKLGDDARKAREAGASQPRL